MAVLVVGADRLGNISDELHQDGVDEIIHWKGRSNGSFKMCFIPKEVNMVIVFYDFVNHNLMGHIKKQAKKNDIPVIYSKRALAHLRHQIETSEAFSHPI